MAWRAGAEATDVEFYQFHPTALYVAGAPRKLISEAVRGEGALLLNARGERFMPHYHERAELAPRDAVSRAIVNEIRETGRTAVYLDMRHIPSARLDLRFPGIRDLCARYDIDIAGDLVPVRPAAHYHVGGVRVDVNGRTTVPRLYACGEVAATGLHGANRLGSNSLLEGLVLGARAGDLAGRRAAAETDGITHGAIRHDVSPARHGAVDLHDVTNALRAVSWRNLGIERSRFSLEEALTMMTFWSRYVMDQEFAEEAGWQLQNMLVVAGLIAAAALRREESRGVHFRTDFPERIDPQWRAHLRLVRGRSARLEQIEGR
jgi:L-aspartate oxidase